MLRRQFLKATGASTLSGLSLLPWAEARAAQAIEGRLHYQGSDISNWQAVLGDGIFVAPEEAPASQADIATLHWGDHSELQANVQHRGVMAHNISYTQQVAATAFDYIHLCEIAFRLPFMPSTGNWQENAQTFEISFFIWDGSSTRLDYGLALQWILNPWMSSFGDIRAWINEPNSVQPNPRWQRVGHLPVDTNWHTMKLAFDYRRQTTDAAIDGQNYPSAFSITPKDSTWSNETAARFAAEIISIFPGNNHNAPIHRAELRNWQWHWIPAGT